MDIRAPNSRKNPYRIFSREAVGGAAHTTTADDARAGEFDRLDSCTEPPRIRDVEENYLPTVALVVDYVDAAQRAYYAQRQSGTRDRKVPNRRPSQVRLRGGKSTGARAQALLVNDGRGDRGRLDDN